MSLIHLVEIDMFGSTEVCLLFQLFNFSNAADFSSFCRLAIV